MQYDIEVAMVQSWEDAKLPPPVQKFDPPYFYVGLAEDEYKAELLAKIKETNEEFVGKILHIKGDYVIRRGVGYCIMEEVWDGCAENFILEIRNEGQAIELLGIIATHGRKLWETIRQLEKTYCKEKNYFMNYSRDEEEKIVAGFIIGLKRQIAVGV